MSSEKQTKEKADTNNKHVVRSWTSPRKRVYAPHDPESNGAKQSFTDECDINRIVNQFVQTGQITHVQKAPPQYGYAPDQTFDQAMRTVADTKSQFELLPAEIREKFQNNAGMFLQAVQDPEQREKLEILGVLDPETPKSADSAPEAEIDPISPPAEPPPAGAAGGSSEGEKTLD